jgi:sugar lactone lactonase YvrE
VTDGAVAVTTVTYAAAPTAGKLWTRSGRLGGAPMVAFDAASLVSGNANAALKPMTRTPRAATFDRRGNLWLLGSGSDPTLTEYTAASLAGSPSVAVEINVRGYTACTAGPNALAFDPTGNLWITVPCANKVVRLTPSELAASGDVTPAVELRGVAAPSSVAFDFDGNLWVAAGDLAMYRASKLGETRDAPDQTIAIAATGAASAASASNLAFDKLGNLWVTVTANYHLAWLRAIDLVGTGARSVAPAHYMYLGGLAEPSGLAIDDAGLVWFAYTRTRVGAVAASSTDTTKSSPDPTVPAIIVHSADMWLAGGILFYPAAAGLPLYHSAP